MAEKNTEAKLKKLLKQQKVQLWNPPYTEEDEQAGHEHVQALAQRYAPLLSLPVAEVADVLETIRAAAVRRGRGNRVFRETSVATLELLLPRDGGKEKVRSFLETRLDVALQQVLDRIGEEFGLRHVKLILNGRTLSADQHLDQQGVKNHSKIMVLKVSDAEEMQRKEEEKKNQSESIQRTQKGFQILSERDGSEDPESTPYLEIADQKGNPLEIPHKEKKALILAMGFHERGRSLMKRRQYDNALSHLLQADQQFRYARTPALTWTRPQDVPGLPPCSAVHVENSRCGPRVPGTLGPGLLPRFLDQTQCGSALLSSVDNYAVLQLDIVWCYRALEALSCLDDGRSRLQRAEEAFLHCYGEQQERLLLIKGNTGREDALFLRLYLLQSLLSYIEGNDSQARLQLSKVETLFGRLCPDSEKMSQLMSLGFSEREARLGLRACRGDLQEAAAHISNCRQERQELMQREKQKKKSRLEAISTLVELGFSRRDAARALHHAGGDVDQAYHMLLDSSQARTSSSQREAPVPPERVEQLLYLGFDQDSAEAALRLTGGDVQAATQLLLDNQGVLSPELLSPPSNCSSPSSEEPSTSSATAEDNELVNEVLEDIPHHEEDYLDLTLEEESELISTLKSYLSQEDTHSV